MGAVTVGKFKVPVGLERIQSANDIRFIERGFPTSLAAESRSRRAARRRRRAAALFNYTVGYTNGVTDGGSSESNATPDVENDAKGDFAARVFFQPFLNSDNFALRGLGFGLAGTYVDSTGSATNHAAAAYRTPGQADVLQLSRRRLLQPVRRPPSTAHLPTASALRWSPQFYYYYNSFGVLGEYANVSQDVSRAVGAVDALRYARQQGVAASVLVAHHGRGGDDSAASIPATPFELGKPGLRRVGAGRSRTMS